MCCVESLRSWFVCRELVKSFVISGLPGLWELKYRNLIASVIVLYLRSYDLVGSVTVSYCHFWIKHCQRTVLRLIPNHPSNRILTHYVSFPILAPFSLFSHVKSVGAWSPSSWPPRRATVNMLASVVALWQYKVETYYATLQHWWSYPSFAKEMTLSEIETGGSISNKHRTFRKRYQRLQGRRFVCVIASILLAVEATSGYTPSAHVRC